MKDKRILYVSSEVVPYLAENEVSLMSYDVPKMVNDQGGQIRIFMPRYGNINERRHQLHEVIRLSGMNIIINDLDQPLIIKVASLPGERLQVYFIDNEEYFKRKQYYFDDEGQPFPDNDERAIFFARGVIETIKKLNWVPDIIHINGWMASFIPIYLKHFYKTDSYFNDTKMVMSVYNEKDAQFENNITEKLEFDNIKDLSALENPTFQNFVSESMNLVDIVVKGDEFLEDRLEKAFEKATSKKFDYVSGESITEVY